MHGRKSVVLSLPGHWPLIRQIEQGVWAAQRFFAWDLVRVNPNYFHSAWAGAAGGIHFLPDPHSWSTIPEGYRAVNVSCNQERQPFVVVWPDNEAIGRLAARHLLGLGLKTLLFFTMSSNHYGHERWAGFARELEAAGVAAVSDADLEYGDTGVDARRFLARFQPPLGVFAVTDGRAGQVLKACDQLGWRVPEEVTVLGVGNDPYATRAPGLRLTSIDPNGELIGRECCRVLNDMLDGKPVPPITRVPPKGIVEGESSDRIGDPLVARAVGYIRAHAADRLRAYEVAAALGVSLSSLHHRFRALRGHTLHAEIRRARLAHACTLLEHTDHVIAAVAEASGFSCLSRFHKEFKAAFGRTPAAYREGFR